MLKITYSGKEWFAIGIDKDGRIKLSSSNGEVENTCTTTENYSGVKNEI